MKDRKDIIEIKNLNKWYGDFHVLKDINLTIKKGEIIVVCGPSGSGKSTLIRCINRLEEFQEGSIVVDGIELVDDARIEDLGNALSELSELVKENLGGEYRIHVLDIDNTEAVIG